MFLKLIKNTLLFLFFIVSFSITGFAQKDNEKTHKHVSLELISSVNTVGKEKELHLGLYFKLDPGWKIYWKYPGKAGYPPNIDWSKSKNLKDLEIMWPKPEEFEVLSIKSFGYSKEVILPIKLVLEKNNHKLLANFDVDYLTCKKICIPFNDNLVLNIPAGDGEISKYNKIIYEYVDKSNYTNYANFLNPDSIIFFLLIAFITFVFSLIFLATFLNRN